MDLYIGAHKHYYERLAPLYRSKLCDNEGEGENPAAALASGRRSGAQNCGSVYIVHGAAGNNEPLSTKGVTHKEWVRGSDYEHRGFLEFGEPIRPLSPPRLSPDLHSRLNFWNFSDSIVLCVWRRGGESHACVHPDDPGGRWLSAR